MGEMKLNIDQDCSDNLSEYWLDHKQLGQQLSHGKYFCINPSDMINLNKTIYRTEGDIIIGYSKVVISIMRCMNE